MSQSHKDLMKKVIEQFDIADVNVFSPDFDDAKLYELTFQNQIKTGFSIFIIQIFFSLKNFNCLLNY